MASDADLEVVRRAFAAYARGDVTGAMADAAEDVVVYAPPTVMNSGTFHGVEGYLTWLGRWLEAWETFEVDVLELERVGARHVLTTTKQTGIGRGSGIPVEQDAFYVSEVRDGKILAFQIYLDRDEALAAIDQREASE